jgi:hypothetical protein
VSVLSDVHLNPVYDPEANNTCYCNKDCKF